MPNKCWITLKSSHEGITCFFSFKQENVYTLVKTKHWKCLYFIFIYIVEYEVVSKILSQNTNCSSSIISVNHLNIHKLQFPKDISVSFPKPIVGRILRDNLSCLYIQIQDVKNMLYIYNVFLNMYIFARIFGQVQKLKNTMQQRILHAFSVIIWNQFYRTR